MGSGAATSASRRLAVAPVERGARLARGQARRRPSAVLPGQPLDYARLPEWIEAAQASFNAKYPVDIRGLTCSYSYIGIKRLGTGQFYLISIKDEDGQPFHASTTYRLTVPELAHHVARVSRRLMRPDPAGDRSGVLPACKPLGAH